MNTVTWSVEMTEKNAPLIDKVNTLLIPGYGGTTEAPAKTETKKPAAKKGMTLTALKKEVKAVKEEFGQEHIENVLTEDFDIDDSLTFAKQISALNPDDYEKFLEAIKTAPAESDEDDEFDDEEFDDIEDEETVSVEDVKAAVKSFAKENGKDEAKAAMGKVGIKLLADIGDLSAAKLTKLYGLVS